MKKQQLLLCMFIVFTHASAQMVIIPDSNFKAALIAKGIDVNEDKEIQTTEVEGVKTLVCNFESIKDLTGIEAFAALEHLNCSGNDLLHLNLNCNKSLKTLLCQFNKLISLDVSQNKVLTRLECAQNKLESLDISINTELTFMDCFTNKIVFLDASKNQKLDTLYCYENYLVSLNVSDNASLLVLLCNSNCLTSLDVRNSCDLTYLDCSSNPLLYEACVHDDHIDFTTVEGWQKDIFAKWSMTCSVASNAEIIRE